MHLRAGVALVCVLANAAAWESTWVGAPVTLHSSSYTWTFEECRIVSGSSFRIYAVELAVETPRCSGSNLVVTAGCPATSNSHLVPSKLCDGLTSNDYFFVPNNATHTVHPNVHLSWSQYSSSCAFSLYVSQPFFSSVQCPVTVTPTVYYDHRGPVPLPPGPPLPPTTPTWDGEEQRLDVGVANRWNATLGDLDPPLLAARFSQVALEVFGSFWECYDEQFITVSAGCRVGAGAECTGYTVQESFLLLPDNATSGNYTHVYNMSTNVLVTNVHGPADMFSLTIAQDPPPTDSCYVSVTPTLLYTEGAPPTPEPPVPTPAPTVVPTAVPTPVPTPVTPVPQVTPVPITPGVETPAPMTPGRPTPVPAQPGHLCPEYETDAPNTVAVVPCGVAVCRTPVYFPLNRIAQACNPCVDGLLPFNLQIVAGPEHDEYTLTFILAAGKVLTLSPACGTCSSVEGISIALPCRPKHGRHSNTVLIIAIVAGALGGALLGCAVKMLCSRHGRRDGSAAAKRLQALEDDILRQQRHDGTDMYQVLPEESDGLHLQESNPPLVS